MSVALFRLIHTLAVLVWVGGMFFAYVILRKSAAESLQTPSRLRLWNSVFRLFFNWVWLAVFVLLSSGLYMIYQIGGMEHMPRYMDWMLALGVVMLLIFAYVFFGCYARYSLLVEAKDWANAEILLATMRTLIAINLVIGLLTVVVAVIGRGM